MTTWPSASTPWTWNTDLAMSRPIVVIACMLGSSNCGGLNSPHIHGTHVPVEEPSTASIADIATSSRDVCFASAFGRYKLLIAGVQIVIAGRVLMAIILIVEDDSFIRETAEMMIQDLGYHTLSASDIDEALLLLRSPQHIDALFTDIS